MLRFIEDNWLGAERIGQGSFDAIANSITQVLDFSHNHNAQGSLLILDPNTVSRSLKTSDSRLSGPGIG